LKTKIATENGAAAGRMDVLRQQAEKIARDRATTSLENLNSLSAADAQRVLHDLQVHQIELELQNEELRQAQDALEASRARYFDLYDLAPVGYFTLDEGGLILEANLTGATLLGVSRGALVRHRLAALSSVMTRTATTCIAGSSSRRARRRRSNCVCRKRTARPLLHGWRQPWRRLMAAHPHAAS